jgi:hypothetical protein
VADSARHVAFMLHGVADNNWGALKTHGNFRNTMQHENTAEAARGNN